MELSALGYMEIDAVAAKNAATAFISECKAVVEDIVVRELQLRDKTIADRTELRKTWIGRFKDKFKYYFKIEEYKKLMTDEYIRKEVDLYWVGNSYWIQCIQLQEAADIAVAAGDSKLLLSIEKTWVFDQSHPKEHLNKSPGFSR